jgi:hypothetical protein
MSFEGLSSHIVEDGFAQALVFFQRDQSLRSGVIKLVEAGAEEG